MLITNASVATMADPTTVEPAHNHAIAIQQDQIAWVGPMSEIPAEYAGLEPHDAQHRLITPGLVDCHTHVVFGGHRAKEFEMRLEGASYEEIARSGGGIVSTVAATRAASHDDLLSDALLRVDALISEGITTLEVKSGYGLDLETEVKMLQVAREIAQHRDIRVVTSFLGAHATPAGVDPDHYIDEICIPALRKAHELGLADAVDAFCEGIAFQPDQVARVYDAAQELGLLVKIHAEQLSNLGGATLAARYGAMSADHIEYIDESGVKAMAAAQMVAVLLPGAFYTLRETQAPPIDVLRAHNVPIAIATDCNPGSSPMTSLLLSMNMACTLFRMTPKEAALGVTRYAAQALNKGNIGQIKAGFAADLAFWDVETPSELSYRIGFNPLHKRMFGGKFT